MARAQAHSFGFLRLRSCCGCWLYAPCCPSVCVIADAPWRTTDGVLHADWEEFHSALESGEMDPGFDRIGANLTSYEATVFLEPEGDSPDEEFHFFFYTLLHAPRFIDTLVHSCNISTDLPRSQRCCGTGPIFVEKPENRWTSSIVRTHCKRARGSSSGTCHARVPMQGREGPLQYIML